MRKITKIMTGWNFTGQDGIRTAVNLPHTWMGKMDRTAVMIITAEPASMTVW